MQYQNLIFFALLAGVFWFLVVRPQQQRQKQHLDMLQELDAGDEIVTIGGMYATVVEVGDRVRIALLDGTELEVAPQAVARVIEPTDQEQDDAGEQSTEAERYLSEPQADETDADA